MRNPSLDQIETLVAIADLGTLAAAAQALHLAPPTVSLHVKELEGRLGVPLLNRGRRRASLTPAGLALVQGGRRLIAMTDELVDQVRRCGEGREGVVRVATSAGVNAHLLPALLSRLSQRAPGIEIKLEILGSAEAMARLRAETIDIGIVAIPQSPSAGIELSVWREDPMVAFVPSAWNAPKQVSPEWLAGRPWISFAPATQMHQLVAAWFGRGGFHPRPVMQINYPEAIKSLVSAGMATAILPLEHAHDGALDERLTVRHLKPSLVRPLGLAYRNPKLGDVSIVRVLETLQEFSSFSKV